MLIQELKKHFPARMPEWWNAGTMFAWGAYVLLHPGIFNNVLYNGMIEIATGWRSVEGLPAALAAERLWGLVTVVVGLLRMCALFVNGSYSRTPMIRLVCSLVSAFVWAQLVVGLMQVPEGATGVVIYSSVLLLDLVSAYRASTDTAIAEAARRASASAGGSRRGGSNYSFG